MRSPLAAPGGNRVAAPPLQGPTKNGRFWGGVLVFYFLMEFVRPQALVPPLGYLRLGMLTSLGLILFVWGNRELVDWKSPPVCLTLYFVGLMAVLVPIAHNGFRAYQVTQGMFLVLPVIVAMLLLIRDRQELSKFLHLQGLIIVYLAGYALTHGGRGPGSFLADENDLALHADTWLPFFFYLYTSAESKKAKFMALFYLAAGIVTVVVSLSRGGFVGLLAVGAVYWWFSRYKVRMLLGLGIIAGLGFLLIDPSYWQDMSTITDTGEGTAKGRIESWKAGWRMFLDNPWGVGPGNFNFLFGFYQGEGFAKNMWGRAAHSLWFTLIPEMGVIGIVLYLRLIWSSYTSCRWLRKDARKKADRNPREFELATACLAAMAGFFASASFLSALYYPQFWILAALICCAQNVYQKEGRDSALLPSGNWRSQPQPNVM